MEIRIDHIRSGPTTIIYIAGRLTKTSIVQLNKSCDSVEKPLVIDISSLLFADEEGIDAIRAILARGAAVRGASPFLTLLLEDGQNEKQGPGNINHL